MPSFCVRKTGERRGDPKPQASLALYFVGQKATIFSMLTRPVRAGPHP